MAAFFPNVLDKFLSPTFLEEVRKKFHYDETQIHEFQAVAEEMLPLMREEAFWEKSVYSGKNKHQSESYSVIYCNAALCSRRKKHFIFDSINTITAPSFR